MKSLLYLLLLGSIQVVHAQTPDSLRIEQTTEDARISATEVKRFIRYITRADVEERTLVKVGVWPASDRFRANDTRRFRLGTNFGIAIEQKLSSAWSFIGGLYGYWYYAEFRGPTLSSRPVNSPATPYDFAALHTRTLELDLELGTRYYYTQRRRASGATRVSNFSGNYLAGNIGFMAGGRSRTTAVNRFTGELIRTGSGYNTFDLSQPRFSLLYGVQRRLGKFGYFDVNAGPELHYQSPTKGTFGFQLNALIGFGW